MKNISRRDFLGLGMLALATTPVWGRFDLAAPLARSKSKFEISLAEWSLNRAFYGGTYDHLDFPKIAKQEFDISILDHVCRFFKNTSTPYLNELNKRAKDYGVKNNMIQVGGVGDLGEPDATKRAKNVENHYVWVDAAKYLGCKSVRVNAYGKGTREELAANFAESLHKLGEYGAKEKINIIIENHGGYSSDVPWLLGVIRQVNLPNVGTLPDFGNFCIKSDQHGCIEEYDRYQGVRELLPYAKALSAKSYDFDAAGNETTIDYLKMLQLIKDAGFSGIIGVEYEGKRLTEYEGIRATKKLIENTLKQLK